jgi:hypothetical protein
MIRVALCGQPHWTRSLIDLLTEYTPDQVAAFHAGPLLSRAARPRGLGGPDVVLRVGFRPGAPTARGRAFDALWRAARAANPKARAVFYWIGTDVSSTLRDARAGQLVPRTFANARSAHHIAGAPWLATELEEVGLMPQPILFPVPLPAVARPEALPSDFRVLTYLPAGRSADYGGHEIIAAARALPDAGFVIVGGRDLIDHPPNLQMPGWVPSMDEQYVASCAVLRLTRHDALGATVREALVHARHVIYTYDLPHVAHVPFGDATALTIALTHMAEQHGRGQLGLNIEGRTHALQAFDPASLTQQLAAALESAADG